MPRPYRKQPWPYVSKDGKRRSYRLGYYDHEGTKRTKVCTSVREANAWAADYSTAAARGIESLRRFLLDLDAFDAHVAQDGRTLAEVVQLWFALHADPRNEGGLAPATFDSYRRTAYRYILGREGHTPKQKVLPAFTFAVELANTPVAAFNEPAPARAWRENMELARVPTPTRTRAWRVLSSALTWAASSPKVSEVQTNGCLLASERPGGTRRSARRGGTGHAPSPTRRRPSGGQQAHWALSPMAVELIRQRLLGRVIDRNPVLALRDATIVSLQYGLACRDQEVYGLRWADVDEKFVEIHEVLSWGQLDDTKTRGSARRTYYPSLLWEDIENWRSALRAYSYGTRSKDFVFPGNLGGKRWGITEPDGSNHFSGNQARKWGPKFFTPAVAEVAKHEDGYADVLRATPYSLRRGGISLRLRAEDAQVVAKEAGTSLQMLDRSYAFAIDDLRSHGPRPADTEWREARAQARKRAQEHARKRAYVGVKLNSGPTLSARRKSGLILPATSTLAKT
jgi:integrase